MKIYLFLAEGFEEIEAIAPIDIFRRADIEVITVSITNKLEVVGAHNVSVLADIIFDEEHFSEQFLIFLPGGMPGTSNLSKHQGLKDLILSQATKKQNIAAICAAPSILGEMGLLENKEAICYPGFENKLLNAIISSNKMVHSGSFFTAKAAGVSIQFALKIVAELKGEDVAKKISTAIYID